MKTKVFFFIPVFLALIAWTVISDQPPGEDLKKQIRVRVLSYNVKNCQGMDGVIDYQRIADVIKRVKADVVALQELDSATQRSKGVVVLDELARLTGMHKTYGASISYQGGKYGIGFLTKEKPLGWKRIPLPGREERRSLLIVELEKIVVACTHFSLTQEDRITSAQIVSNAFREYSKPVIIAGDFNAVPESPVMEIMGTYWQEINDTSVPTSPSDNPRRCIDYIMGLKSDDFSFYRKKAVVELEQVASDHLPVWADIWIRNDGD